MRNKKLLYVLIPVIIVALALIAGIVFVALNSSPEKIFKTAISSAFKMFESSEEQFSTMKGTMNLTASVESDNEEMQAINTMLEGTSINLDMQADTANMVINENLNVILNNENLLNAAIVLQDQKGYVYLKDYLDKYLELPEESMEYSDLTEYYEKIETLDQKALMDAIHDELVVAISAQELVQEDTTLVLDGQETKVTASTLSLKGEAQTTFTRELLTNLKENEKFQTALGAYKEDVLLMIDEELEYLADKENLANNMKNEEFQDEIQDIIENRELKVSIYTKGFLNEFVGISVQQIDARYTRTDGVDLLKHNKEKYELVSYTANELARVNNLNVVIENKKENKNKGTATVTMTVDEEQFVVTYDYEKQGKQLYFSLSTEIEGLVLSLSGNVVENGSNVKGVFIVLIQEETFGKINLNCKYDFTYGVQIQKVDTQNAVLINELSEEDQTTFMTNFQNSALYQLIEQSGLLDSGIETFDEPEVTYDGHTVMYTVPEGFEASEYNSEDYKMYMDEDFNSINVTINYDTVDTYMKDLEDEYVLTSDFYENQKISETRSYTVNGKEYKFRTITYNDEYGSYVELYFAYELDDEYCYVVEVESEGGNISMDTIKYFLDVTVEEGLMPTDNIASTGEEIIDMLQ